MTIGSVLVTGGTGYIGSFTALTLLEADYKVVVTDNLYNSSTEVLNRIELICGKKPEFFQLDITDEAAIDKIFEAHPDIDSVIHFAALKAVGESGEKPLDYYRVNVYGAICLLRSMSRHNVYNIVFSSSATVYGDATRFPNMIPIPEECPIGPTNPYGNTKATVESLITDHINAQRNNALKDPSEQVVKKATKWNGALLRYFNPAGAHPTGIMGEDPQGVPYNLLPLLAQVAVGKREKLLVFGDGRTAISHSVDPGGPHRKRFLTKLTVDYASDDGTAIRDYVHILDLARGHLMALAYLQTYEPGVRAWNLGTGKGSTVFDMIKAFEAACGKKLPYEVVGRRAGDVLNLTANPARANQELGWKAGMSLEKACEDLWRWTENNREGYRQSPPQELLDKVKAGREQVKSEAKGNPAELLENAEPIA